MARVAPSPHEVAAGPVVETASQPALSAIRFTALPAHLRWAAVGGAFIIVVVAFALIATLSSVLPHKAGGTAIYTPPASSFGFALTISTFLPPMAFALGSPGGAALTSVVQIALVQPGLLSRVLHQHLRHTGGHECSKANHGSQEPGSASTSGCRRFCPLSRHSTERISGICACCSDS